ncbi:hypothetical protein [uncultured Nostoc sp.]
MVASSPPEPNNLIDHTLGYLGKEYYQKLLRSDRSSTIADRFQLLI